MSHEYDDGTLAAEAANRTPRVFDNTFNATTGMLGNAVPPTSSTVANASWNEERQVFGSGMKEPEELVTPEQEALTLRLRLLAEQVENERLRKAERKARHSLRKRRYYHQGRKQSHRISFSVRLDDAQELSRWMELVSRYNLKLPPKAVLKFRNALAKRLEKAKL